ncbi:hypothetical protein A4R26_31050 [Niastella populi]|uniref:Uncharacterized protein n=1 Tax=Niastella populi TaxID=550983 RepID=A0A1V9ESB5_9BACT|nr:hypothetical protein A4R26_31050 [Niastella populi]
MKPVNKYKETKLTHIPMLTVEDIDKHECFRDWPQEKKEKLIKFVYELSLALYHSYFNANEK